MTFISDEEIIAGFEEENVNIFALNVTFCIYH